MAHNFVSTAAFAKRVSSAQGHTILKAIYHLYTNMHCREPQGLRELCSQAFACCMHMASVRKALKVSRAGHVHSNFVLGTKIGQSSGAVRLFVVRPDVRELPLFFARMGQTSGAERHRVAGPGVWSCPCHSQVSAIHRELCDFVLQGQVSGAVPCVPTYFLLRSVQQCFLTTLPKNHCWIVVRILCF